MFGLKVVQGSALPVDTGVDKMFSLKNVMLQTTSVSASFVLTVRPDDGPAFDICLISSSSPHVGLDLVFDGLVTFSLEERRGASGVVTPRNASSAPACVHLVGQRLDICSSVNGEEEHSQIPVLKPEESSDGLGPGLGLFSLLPSVTSSPHSNNTVGQSGGRKRARQGDVANIDGQHSNSQPRVKNMAPADDGDGKDESESEADSDTAEGGGVDSNEEGEVTDRPKTGSCQRFFKYNHIFGAYGFNVHNISGRIQTSAHHVPPPTWRNDANETRDGNKKTKVFHHVSRT
jgi:hypothetical protein